MTCFGLNHTRPCSDGIVIVLLLSFYSTVCCGQTDTLPARVKLRQVRNGEPKNNPSATELYLTIHTAQDNFKFHLQRSKPRITNVPVFIPRKEGIIKDFKLLHKPSEVYQDVRQNAFFYIQSNTNTTVIRLTGIFCFKDVLYTVKTNASRQGIIKYLLLRKSVIIVGNNINKINRTSKKAVVEDLPNVYSPFMKLNKRQIILYEIELLITIDYSIFKSWTCDILDHERATENDADAIIKDMVSHYTLLIQGIDSRFESIKGYDYMVNVLPVGIFIANVSYACPWKFNSTYISRTTGRPVLTSDAITLLSKWVDANRDQLPVFDHVMAFTANNLAHKENLLTLGVASQQSMCTNRSLSIIEDHGNIAYSSFVATHELAHSLGAKHDGEPPTVKYMGKEETCSTEDGYIMSPRTSSSPKADKNVRSWQFSPCSHLYFDFYIDHLNSMNTNCLLHTTGHFNTSQQGVSGIPTAYSPDEQCTRIHGHGTVMDREIACEHPEDICRSIPCRPEGGPTIETLSMEGTVCGAGRTCRRGKCVTDIDMATESNLYDVCIFGDQPGIIADTQSSCTELINDKPFNCYTYGRVCCTSCQQHLRHRALLSDCRYGDRIPDCDWTMCDSADCCETCAVHSGVLVACPDIPSRPFLMIALNTKSYHHGTVATLSCQSGYHLDGPKQIVCTGNGSWSDRIPICYRGCPKFEDDHVILSTGNVSIGAHVRFRCPHGLSLVGDDTSMCMNNSAWNTTLPTCILKYSSSDTVTLPENTPGGAIVHRLSTGSGQATFRLVGMSHSGFIVHKSGVITVDPSTEIDFEQVQVYRLHIQGTLLAESRFQAIQVLQILIQDINEFEPVFDQSTYTVRVDDFIPPGGRIVKVHATDTDLSTSALTYHLVPTNQIAPGSDVFQIDSSSGEISLKQDASFNSSANEFFKLIVSAVDDGIPEVRTGSTTVEICTRVTCTANAPFLSYDTSLFLMLVLHFRVVRV